MLDQFLAANLHLIVLFIFTSLLLFIKKSISMIDNEVGMYEGMSVKDKFWFDRTRSWTNATTDYIVNHRKNFNVLEFKQYLIRSVKRETVDGITDKTVASFYTPKQGLSLNIQPFGQEKSFKLGYSWRF